MSDPESSGSRSSDGSGGSEPVRILFVCLGNICRSPLAEGVFRHLAGERGLEGRVTAESAGTGGWHVGQAPDPRSREVAERNGIALEGSARQVAPSDLEEFDWIIAMDASNRDALLALAPSAERARLHLLREFDPEGGPEAEVPDPYYGGEGGFDRVYEMVYRSCEALLNRVVEEEGAG